MTTQNQQAARDRINHLQVVVNREEWRRIQERAMEAGLSVSAYLRTIGLGKAIRPGCQRAQKGL